MPIDASKGLYIRWSKKERDYLIYFPRACDGHYINSMLTRDWPYRDWKEEGGPIRYENNLLQELDKRGYDLTTLKFSIQKKKQK